MKYRFIAGRLTSRTEKRAERTAGWESQVTREHPHKSGAEQYSRRTRTGRRRTAERREFCAAEHNQLLFHRVIGERPKGGGCPACRSAERLKGAIRGACHEAKRSDMRLSPPILFVEGRLAEERSDGVRAEPKASLEQPFP